MNPSIFAIPQKVEIPAGAYGGWQLPELGVSIPVYRAFGYAAQKVVDTQNAALLQNFGVGKLIADHAESKSNDGRGSWDLWKCHPDDSAFFILPNETQQYRCISVSRVLSRRLITRSIKTSFESARPPVSSPVVSMI